MSRSSGRATAVGVALLLVLGACSQDVAPGANRAIASSASASSSDENQVVPGKTKFGPDDDDAIIRRAVDDVQAFYEDEFPKLYGQAFSPLSGGVFPYGPDDPPPNCGGPGKSDYKQVAQNAFYCPQGDFMAWDTVNLTNDLLDNFGPFTLAIVVAHELGHAIQARHGILDGRFITFVTEQQADCFAGSYTQHVQQGGSKEFKVTSADLDAAVGGFLLIRDPVGTDVVKDENAHGSAFQRINAFSDGLKDGAEKCKTYEDLSFNFVPESEPGTIPQGQTGDLPFPEVEPLVEANLEGFWPEALNAIGRSGKWTPAKTNPFDPAQGVTCGDKSFKGDDAVGKYLYCPDNDTISFDEVNLMPEVYRKIGDLGEAEIIAKLYSQRAQRLAGLPTDTIESTLQADCFTGVWVATTKTDEVNNNLPDDAVLRLSPGDLDEAVSTFLAFGAKAAEIKAGTAERGTAFDRLDAFRSGFFEAFNNGLASGMKTCTK
jgi:predicted metalloprotease